MRRLTFHADDLGMTAGVTDGIVQSMTQGVVSGASAMVCRREYRERVAQAAAVLLPGKVGLHLQLTDGEPISPLGRIPSLVDGEGRFARHRKELGSIDPEDLWGEWNAQWDALVSLGVEPAYLDTHHHVHSNIEVFSVYKRLAAAKQVPARGVPGGLGVRPEHVTAELRAAGVQTTDGFVCIWTRGTPSLSMLQRTLDVYARIGSEDMSLEIGCHPGHADEELQSVSSYALERRKELDILCDPSCDRLIREAGWVRT